MTKDEIIQLAKECELVAGNADHGIYLMALQRFAALVAEKEREACAKVCDEVDKESQSQWPKRLSTMIRARGNK